MSNPFDLGALGGLGGLGSMVSTLQQQMKQTQAEAEAATFQAEAGGGLVRVTVQGSMRVLSVDISEEAFEDREMLEDLVIAAINNGLQQAQEHVQQKMGALTAGLPIPPGMLGL